MPVQSSDVTVNGGTIVQPTSGPNLALILGLSIPLGIICNYIFILVLSLIGYCIFRNTRKPLPELPTTSTDRGVRE
jgi:hypothetical protein